VAFWKDTRVPLLETGPVYECGKLPEVVICDWSAESFDALKRLITKQVPEGYFRREAMERIEARLDPSKPVEEKEDMAKFWEEKASSSPTKEVYEKRVTEVWHEMGCAAEGAPYVLRGLLYRLEGLSSPFGYRSPQPSVLAAAFLDEARCSGARGLTEAEKAKLKEIRDRAAPASKP